MLGIVSLRSRDGFDTDRYRAWLRSCPMVQLDPAGSGTFMISGYRRLAAEHRFARRLDGAKFPYCVLVDIAPNQIDVVQEYGKGAQLTIARDFVALVVEETDCRVYGDHGEHGKEWTDDVRRNGPDILYGNCLLPPVPQSRQWPRWWSAR